MVLSQWGKRWSAQEAAEGQSSGSDGALNDLPKPDKLARQQASEPHRADSARAPSSSAALGSGAEPSKPTSPGATAQDVTFAPTFIRIVSILMRSPHYRHYALSHVEVVPLLLAGQYPVMDAKINEKRVPIAAALWASVSEDVDERLSENLTVPIKLRPDEWRSRDILWLIDAAGEAGIIFNFRSPVQATSSMDREAKFRCVGTNLQPTIQRRKFCTTETAIVAEPIN